MTTPPGPAGTAPVGAAPDAIAAVVAALAGTPATTGIESVTQVSGGASRETFVVRVTTVGGPVRSLVVQVTRPGSERSTAVEASVLRAAAAAGVPVAGVVDVAGDDSSLGAPYLVVEYVPGETIARRILRDDDFAVARRSLAGQLGTALGRLHRVDPATVPGLEPLDPLTRYRDVLDDLAEPHPVFEVAFRRLERTRPRPSARSAVVHGDARLGNLVVDGSGLAALIDWELAHVGDPMEDLGWLCARPWRFGGSAPVGGFGSYADLLDAYTEASGTPVDLDTVHWWEAVASLTWGVMGVAQADAHRSGRRRSHELAAIGRRVCETEYDLLTLLAPGGYPPATAPVTGATAAGPHDGPSAAELVEAVREWIERDLLAATGGRLRFHARVAAGVLATVERELALGPAQAAAHRERLASLGCRSDVELAAAIRSGALDDRDPRLLDALRAAVVDKLAVANPRYLTG